MEFFEFIESDYMQIISDKNVLLNSFQEIHMNVYNFVFKLKVKKQKENLISAYSKVFPVLSEETQEKLNYDNIKNEVDEEGGDDGEMKNKEEEDKESNNDSIEENLVKRLKKEHGNSSKPIKVELTLNADLAKKLQRKDVEKPILKEDIKKEHNVRSGQPDSSNNNRNNDNSNNYYNDTHNLANQMNFNQGFTSRHFV